MIIYIGNALSRHGIAPTAADVLSELLRSEGHEVVLASSYRNIFFRMLHMLATICRYGLRASAVFIDVYSTRNFWYAYLCALLCRTLRISYIPILHGGDFPRRMDASHSMVRFMLDGAFRVIVPSGYLLDELTKRGYFASLIPNTIPVSKYLFTSRKFVRPRLIFVRSFSRIYQPQMALYVLKRLRQSYPDACLCMVGPDKDGTLQVCRDLALELGVADAVIFTGMLDKTAWHDLSADYSIFINTTTKDNMPVSVIEAMALGLPVVSTNPGGIPYLIEDGVDGLVVDVGDVEAMVQAVKRLVEMPDLMQNISTKARHKAETFDWTSVKRQWLDLVDLAREV